MLASAYAFEDWNPGKRMRSATEGLLLRAGQLGSSRTLRFVKKDHCIFGGFVQQSESCRLLWKLDRGTTYTFVASGDGYARDVDITIKSQDGLRTFAKNDSDKRDAVVVFTPSDSAEYLIDTKLFSGRDGKGAFISLAVFADNGYTVPLQNLKKAFDELDDSCSKFNELQIGRGQKPLFADRNGSWSLVGGVVQSGQRLGLYDIALSQGNYAVLAAGDYTLADADLTVTRDGVVAGRDSRHYKDAYVSFAVQSTTLHDVTLTNYKSNGSSFVMFAILSIK